MSLSLALAGTGWSGEYHAFAASSISTFSMKAVFSPYEMEAKDFARRHHIPLHYNDMEYLLEYSSPDIVVVATPTTSHLKDVEYIAGRGVSIILESPIAETRRDAERIAETAEREGIYLFPVSSFSSDPALKELEKEMAEGFFGPSPHFSALWSFPSPLERWRRNGRKMSVPEALVEAGAEAFSVLRSLSPSSSPVGAEEMDGGISVFYADGSLALRNGNEGFSVSIRGNGREAVYSNGTLELDGRKMGKRAFPRQLAFLKDWYMDTLSILEEGTWSSSFLSEAVESVSDGEKVLSYIGNNCLSL
ncbi:MAG: Gfo/Idh/MocA family protein [Candidatus Ornithospirochaeta sp.]